LSRRARNAGSACFEHVVLLRPVFGHLTILSLPYLPSLICQVLR